MWVLRKPLPKKVQKTQVVTVLRMPRLVWKIQLKKGFERMVGQKALTAAGIPARKTGNPTRVPDWVTAQRRIHSASYGWNCLPLMMQAGDQTGRH